MTRKITVTAAIGIALAVAGGVAVAAIPGPDGTIKGCFDNSSGNLRVFDPQENMPRGCGRNETLLSWSQAGPSGPAGPQGERGPQGEQGPPGAPGADGEDGQDGAPGAAGLPGAPGKDGVDGATGPAGPPGTPGQDGQDGQDGISGYEVVVSEVEVGGGGASAIYTPCPEGKVVIGGGAFVDGELPDGRRAPFIGHWSLAASSPTPVANYYGAGEGWYAAAEEPSSSGVRAWLVVTAICANVAP